LRDKARQLACLSNLRQLATATIKYAQDYDEQFPPDRMGGTIDQNYVPKGWTWRLAVKPYVKNDRVWICPSVTPRMWFKAPLGLLTEVQQDVLATNAYPGHPFICNYGPGSQAVSMASSANPANSRFILESRATWLCGHGCVRPDELPGRRRRAVRLLA
jgi:hypothetical protein